LYQHRGRTLLAIALLVVLAGAAAPPPAAAQAVAATAWREAANENLPEGGRIVLVGPPALGQDAPPPEQIRVTDLEDTPLPARIRSLPPQPLEVVVVADVGAGPTAVTAIRDGLRELILGLPEGTAVTVVAAGAEPRLLASLTRSPQQALAGLALLSPSEPALPEAAIGLGLDQLTGAEGTRPVVVEVRTGSHRSTTTAGPALDPVRERLAAAEVDVYAVQLGTPLTGAAERLPVDRRGGLFLQARGTDDLLGALDTVATDLGLPRYQVDLELDDVQGVRVISDWRGTRSELTTIMGPAEPERREEPSEPGGSPLGTVAVVVGSVALIAAALLVPPMRRRRRLARESALPPRRAGVRVTEDPGPSGPPPRAVPLGDQGLEGDEVAGVAAVRELLAANGRRVSEVWVAEDLDPSLRTELTELAERRHVPVRTGTLPGTAVPVAARAAPLAPVRTDVLWSVPDRPVVLVLAGTPSPAELGGALRELTTGEGSPVVTGVVLPRQPSSRMAPATTAAAAGALERLPIALVPDLALALREARAAGVRVLGVVGPGAAAAHPLSVADLEGPTVLVLDPSGDLDRQLRARCDAVISLAGTGLVDRAQRLAAELRATVAASEAEEGPVEDPRTRPITPFVFRVGATPQR
jgi:23S rRNA (guanosine2251-2'-O)-methyltransferase